MTAPRTHCCWSPTCAAESLRVKKVEAALTAAHAREARLQAAAREDAEAVNRALQVNEKLRAEVERLREEKGHLDDAWKAQYRGAVKALRERCWRVIDQWFAGHPPPNQNPAHLIRAVPLEVE